MVLYAKMVSLLLSVNVMSEHAKCFDAWWAEIHHAPDSETNAKSISKIAYKAGQEIKIAGLQADLEAAVNVAFYRGATKWVELNYPNIYKQIVKSQKEYQ